MNVKVTWRELKVKVTWNVKTKFRLEYTEQKSCFFGFCDILEFFLCFFENLIQVSESA